MTHYKAGADFERKTKRYLEIDGYFTVRSAGSHSPVDLVAVKENKLTGNALVLLVQCKRGGHLSGKDARALTELAHEIKAQAFLAHAKNRALTLVPVKA